MTDHRIEFLNAAASDVRETFAWYDDQRPGLGYDFLHDLDETLRRMAAHPELYAAVTAKHRRAVLHGFPYFVSYRVHLGVVQVIGVFHTHRDPLAIARHITKRRGVK